MHTIQPNLNRYDAVNVTTRAAAKVFFSAYYKYIFGILGVLMLTLGMAAYTFGVTSHFIIITIVVLGIYTTFIAYICYVYGIKLYYENISKELGWKFSAFVPAEEVLGRNLLQKGVLVFFQNVLEGSICGYPVHMGAYSCEDAGSDDVAARNHYLYNIIQVKLGVQVPEIIIAKQQNFKGNFFLGANKMTETPIDPSRRDLLIMFSEESLGEQPLVTFDEKILDILNDKWSDYSIVFWGNSLCIFSPCNFETRSSIQRARGLVVLLIEHLVPALVHGYMPQHT